MHLRKLKGAGVLFFIFVFFSSFILTAHATGGDYTLPTQPRPLDTSSAPKALGNIYHASPNNIQTIIDNAEPGSAVELSAGVVYPPIHLPKKNQGPEPKWIIIESESADQANKNFNFFPKNGVRMTPEKANLLPKIVTGDSSAAIYSDAGASYYWLTGLEVAPAAGVSSKQGTLVILGNANSTAPEADHIVLDRLYIHGNPNKEWARGVMLNSAASSVINSTINEIHTYTYQDASVPRREAQGISAWNTPGPIQIKNNLISASTEDILIGGSTSCAPSMAPSDVEITGNHFYKPVAWRTAEIPHWWVKNHLEFKSGRRVLVSGNLFENVWQDSAGDQKGVAMLLSPRNQTYPSECGGQVASNPWSEVSDVSILNNVVYNAGQGIAMSSEDPNAEVPTGQTSNLRIVNNLFYGSGKNGELSPDGWGNGTLFSLVTGKHYGVKNLIIDHNTALQNGAALVADSVGPQSLADVPRSDLIFQNNITNWQGADNISGFKGIAGSGAADGFGDGVAPSAFGVYFHNVIFRQNIMLNAPNGTSKKYAADGVGCSDVNLLGCNFFNADPNFVSSAAGNFSLASASLYKGKSTDSFTAGIKNDIGVSDWGAVAAAAGQAGTGLMAPSPLTIYSPPAPTQKFSRNLSYGASGLDVKLLQ